MATWYCYRLVEQRTREAIDPDDLIWWQALWAGDVGRTLDPVPRTLGSPARKQKSPVLGFGPAFYRPARVIPF